MPPLKKCSVPSTFDEFTAKAMVGERVPDGGSLEDRIYEGEPQVAQVSQKPM